MIAIVITVGPLLYENMEMGGSIVPAPNVPLGGKTLTWTITVGFYTSLPIQ
jgi:hypothetical protein